MSKFSYVYVLTSKTGDTYYEQTLVSAISLRSHMPQANIILVVDDKTNESLIGNRAEIKKYVSSVMAITLPNSLTNLQKSRWMKTSLPQYISEDFLYIDSDTIITSSLEEIETVNVELGAILDRHQRFGNHCLKDIITENAKKLNFVPAVNDMHFNGGVILVRKNDRNIEFFKKWHSLWLDSAKKGLSIDQIALAQANYLMGGLIQELPGEWNCQVENGTKFLYKAKILHMLVAGERHADRKPHELMKSQFYREIEKNGITASTIETINDPLSFFKTKTQIIGDGAVDFYNTTLCRTFCLLYSNKKTRKLFDVFNGLTNLIMKLKRKPVGAYSKIKKVEKL